MSNKVRFLLLVSGCVLAASLSTYADKTATAIPTVVNGFVVDITVTDGGGGYTFPPLVTVTGGGGSGAEALATVVNGVVSKIVVTQAGSGYTGNPTVSRHQSRT